MSKQQIKPQVVLNLAILVLAGLLGLIVYRKFVGAKSQPPFPPAPVAQGSSRGLADVQIDPGSFIPVSDLSQKLKEQDKTVVLDVDEREAFAASHIKSAVNIPLDELEVRAPHELEKSVNLILYCRCPSDGSSLLAAKILYKSGFTSVSIVRGGFDAWQQSQSSAQ